MEESVAKLLEVKDERELIKQTQEFNLKYMTAFGPLQLSDDFTEKLWKYLLGWLSDEGATCSHLPCITAIRILSRDKEKVEKIVDSDRLSFIVHLAGLDSHDEALQTLNLQINYEVAIEALKCISNFIMISKRLLRICTTNATIPGLMYRLKTYRDPELPHDIKYYDMRLLFLLSAHAGDIRPALRTEYHGLTYLIDVLDLIMKQEHSDFGISRTVASNAVVFNKADTELGCEILKILYNLLMHLTDATDVDEEEMGHCLQLITILRCFIISRSCTYALTEEFHNHTINLLLTLPNKLYEDLLCPMPSVNKSSAGFCGAIGGIGPEPDDIYEYDGKDMTAIYKLLQFFDGRLKHYYLQSTNNSNEKPVTPILTLLNEMVRSNHTIRKFIRLRVLPPLREVTKRPEEGDTMRNKLCSLMTSPNQELNFLSANFLFVLCKENVDRLIKYTGYGNAAGLLASRGLMLGGRRNVNYSSESEDSDTEEYLKVKDRLNPVTGAPEPVRPSPMEGMTEEQKEYEAMKLVNALEKLASNNLIQPGRIGADGRPQPMNHVLQLIEGINDDTNNNHNESDDSN